MENPDLYEDAYGTIIKNDVEEILEKYKKYLKFDQQEIRLLDIGCGPGNLTKNVVLPRFCEEKCTVVAVDLSSKMVNHAKEINYHEKITYCQLNIEQTEQPVEQHLFQHKFTHAFSSYCLHFIHDTEKALKNVYNMMEKGGQFLIRTIVWSPLGNIYKELAMKSKWAPYMKEEKDHIKITKMENGAKFFTKCAEDAGFRIVLSEINEKHFEFSSVEHMKDSVESIDAFVHKMPCNLGGEYMNELMDELLKYQKEKEKPYVPYKLMAVLLNKD